jgi:hypothetical protein
VLEQLLPAPHLLLARRCLMNQLRALS